MSKLYTISIFIFLAQLSYAQIGIGTTTPDPSATVDVAATDKGFIASNIALQSRTDDQTIPDPADGLMVYNTTTLSGNENTSLSPGYYYWLTDRWVPHQRGEIVEVTTNGELRTYLGYDPTGVHNSTNFSSGGISFTGSGCKQWTDGNGHWYCAYSGHTGFDWQTAFNAAKSRGGYLVTFTSLAEWDWVKSQLINNGTGFNMNTSIWIGYNKVDFSGNPTEFTWITGEKSKVNWGIDNQTEEYFDGGEPNNQGGNEGCVHVKHSNLGSDRRWNDITCESAGGTGWSAPWRHLIIEFHQ